MRFLKLENIKKTIYYLKRNGIVNTIKEVEERCLTPKEKYDYVNLTEAALKKQRKTEFAYPCKFSIVVPAYETKEVYLRELIDSVLNQTYTDFELVIADAGSTGNVEQIVKTYADERIVYKRLEKNAGISENTNAALDAVTGDYIGLLDHDDVLTADALFEMAKAIETGKKTGKEYWMLYSDEDKCDSSGRNFFTPHFKTGFNLDLLLSNNYICHFMMIKTDVMKKLCFRKEYDGAQDYDFVLRLIAKALKEEGYEKTMQERLCHIPAILYHWRCHEASTAVNPKSKEYAYEAGRKAVQDFLDCMGWHAEAVHTCHLGFYDLKLTNVFENIGAVGATGGRIIDRKNKVIGGMRQEGRVCFVGLKVYFEGYMHRAGLRQTAEVLDLRCIRVHPKLHGLFEEITGMKYEENPKDNLFFREKYKKSKAEWESLSEAFSGAVKNRGYRLVYSPKLVYKITEKQTGYGKEEI